MNPRAFLYMFFLFFILLSCNRTDKIIRESLVVRIDLRIYKNDTIQVFYMKQTDDSSSEELSIKKFVEGKNELQTLHYELPVGIKPKNFRIDLGEQANYHDSIRIENVSFKYRDLMLDGSNGEYKKWFIPNKNIYFEKDTLLYLLKIRDGYYDPMLNGNKKLNKKIIKLFPPDIYERQFN